MTVSARAVLPGEPPPTRGTSSPGTAPHRAGVTEEGLARRLKALACTAPLHDLEARKANLAGEYTIYAMAELGLTAIDLVTVMMDFDTGADHDEIIARMRPRVAAQAPGRDIAEYERVARWVLENLINVGNVDRGFRAVYGMWTREGEYVRRDYDFKLLEEVPGSDGRIFLRATDEAINVLVGALDTDVTSAQIAADVKLDHLIRRGRLAEARFAAEQARYRTVQYAETLRRALDATRRNVRAVDWLRAVPDLIDEAFEHVADRYRHENAILINIRRARDEAEESERRRAAAELVDIVQDCIRRHTRLQTRLMEAGPLFRAEQDRQAFAAPNTRTGLDVYGQLLRPVLELPLGHARTVTDAFFAAGTGLRTPVAVRVHDLIETLLTPVAPRENLGAEIPEPDVSPTPDDSRYSERQHDAAAALLDVPTDAPRRLSGLLAQARRLDPDLAWLLALLAFHAASPPVGNALRQGDRTLLVAVDDGTELDDPEVGGADLIIGTALLAPARTDRSEHTHPDRFTPQTRETQEGVPRA